MLTFRDAIDNLVDYVGGETQSGSHRVFRRAIRQAYNTFYQTFPWRYFQSAINLNTSATTFSERLKYVSSTRKLSSEFNVVSATNTTPIRITIESGFTPVDGETVTVRSAIGNTNANGSWVLDKISDTEFDLIGSSGNGVYSPNSGQISRKAFPDWAKDGSVRINNTYYVVSHEVDSYNLILDELRNPKSDATGKFTMQVRHYDLPADFHKMSPVSDSRYAFVSAGYMEPESWLAAEQFGFYATSFPFRWTILAHPRKPGQYRIHFLGYPIENSTVSFIYQRRQNDNFRWSGNEKTTSSVFNDSSVSVTSGSTAVVGTATSFKSSMVGSVLRIGDTVSDTADTNEPEGLDGLNPYVEEFIIESVESPTQLTLRTAPSTTGSSLQYIVSDLIDIAPEHTNAFFRCCEMQYAISTKRDGASLSHAQAAWLNAVRLAMESDYKVSFYGAADGSEQGLSLFGDPFNTDFGTYTSVGP